MGWHCKSNETLVTDRWETSITDARAVSCGFIIKGGCFGGSYPEGPPDKETIEAEVEEQWDTFDVDGSGYLNKKEAKRFAAEFLGKGAYATRDIDYVFAVFDRDGNGCLDKGEMVHYLMGVSVE